MKEKKGKQGCWLYKRQFITISAVQDVDEPHDASFQMYAMMNAAGEKVIVMSEKARNVACQVRDATTAAREAIMPANFAESVRMGIMYGIKQCVKDSMVAGAGDLGSYLS